MTLSEYLSKVAAQGPEPLDIELIENFRLPFKRLDPYESDGVTIKSEFSSNVLLIIGILNSAKYVEIPNIGGGELIDLLATLLGQLRVGDVCTLLDGCNKNETAFHISLLKVCLDAKSHIKLQTLVVDLATRTSLLELRQLSPRVVHRIFSRFCDASCDVRLLQKIEQFFDHVVSFNSQDAFIFYKIFNNANLGQLFEMKTHEDIAVRIRLLDFQMSIFQKVPSVVLENRTFFHNFYQFDSPIPDDVFYQKKFIDLHAVVFDEGTKLAPENKQFLGDQLQDQVAAIFELYHSPDIFYFRNSMLDFLASFSRFNLPKFAELNSKNGIVAGNVNFNKLSHDDVALLASLNPAFLASLNLQDEDLVLNNGTVDFFKNLASDPTTFGLISEKLSPKALDSLTPTNLLAFFSTLATTSHGTQFLISQQQNLLNSQILNPKRDSIGQNYKLNKLRLELIENLLSSLSHAPEFAQFSTKLQSAKDFISSGQIYSSEVKAVVQY